MTEDIQSLIDDLGHRYPNATFSLHQFASGLTMLDVYHRGDWYVLEYIPSEGVGVTKMTSENGFMRGSDAAFGTLAEAGQYVAQVLSAGE